MEYGGGGRPQRPDALFYQFGGSETQKINFRDVAVWLTSDVPASVCVLDNAIVMIYEQLSLATQHHLSGTTMNHTGNQR